MEKLAQAFIKAQEEWFITELSPCSVECLQLCEDCPANKACETLSEGGNYHKFLENYRTKIAPLISQLSASCDIKLHKMCEE